MDRVIVFDTTLRDGEQSPGASMTVEDKLEFAVQLEKLGVDVIEAGFPVSSPQQFEATQRIAQEVRGCTIAGLARSVEADLDRAIEAVAPAANPRIHTFISTSPIHMEHKLRKDPETVIEMAKQAVSYARNRVGEVEFSPEDATRSEPEFLARIIEEVILSGATVINIPDTVGYTVPNEFASLIRYIRENVPSIDKAIISVHCHDDLGLAVANTLAGVTEGARQVEVTVNGIGERAGNAALEEIVMGLRVRGDIHGLETRIDSTRLLPTSRMLAGLIGFPIPRNKAIVGDNAFAHESGIHQDGVIKYRQSYEIMRPQDIGRDESRLVLGRHSGRRGFVTRLTSLGIHLKDEEVERTYARFLEVADRKREVYDEDILALAAEELGAGTHVMQLVYFNVLTGNTAVPTATVRITIGDDTVEEAATGDGPADAVFRAIDRAVDLQPTLREYSVSAVTPGKQALGEVSVVLELDGDVAGGRGSSTDIIEAGARAYLNALNRLQARRSGGPRG